MAARALDRGVGVLILDLDGILLTDIYEQLHSPPVSAFDVVVTDVKAHEGVNCGFVYFRPVRAIAEVHGIHTCRGGNVELSSYYPNSCRPLGNWLAHAIIERILFYLGECATPPARY